MPLSIEIGDLGHRLDAALAAAAAQEDDDVDGLDDQIARHRDDGFLDQLLEAQ